MSPPTGSPVGGAARWRALGTYVQLAVCPASALSRAEALARSLLDRVDQTCSRFRDSDLTRANANSGSWTGVDPLLAAAVEVARDAAEYTDGLVNPLLGLSLISLGYDQDFASLTSRDGGQGETAGRSGPQARVRATRDIGPSDAQAWRSLEIDPNGAVLVPRGTALDLGATGKAWAADLIAVTIRDELGCAALVSVGGDIRTVGAADLGWPVDVQESPDASSPDCEVVLVGEVGLATSSTRVRRWTLAGARVHHLVDPRTAAPAADYWRTVSATGSSCVAANTASTAAIILGEGASDWLSRREVDARLVRADRTVEFVGNWPADARPREGKSAC